MKRRAQMFAILFAFTQPILAVDLDGDGMSDVWQRVYNIPTGNTAADIDGDGQFNSAEAAAGTNPRDANDYFRTFNVSLSPTLDFATLSWRSVEARYYEIEKSTDLNSWTYASYQYGQSNQTTSSRTFSLNSPAQPKMFFRVHGYPEYDYDDDGDGLQSWEERLLSTDPYDRDTDNDGMVDSFEFIYQLNPLEAADAASDLDTDGLSNLWEYKLGLNPQLTDSNSNGISDPLEDRDQDGLTNISELSTHLTLPDQPDTDGDGLGDGWEILYGYLALVNNETDADQTNDPDDDPDTDGLLNSAEDQIGTNPNNWDTDGDGFSDPVEDQSASSATNPASTPGNPGGTPGGPAAPPPPTIPVQVNFGDHSGSHSEKYRVWLEPLEGDANTQKRYRTNRKYGQTQTETFHLPAGAKYKISLTHIGTDPNYDDDPKPDYDYTLEFTSNSTDAAIKAIPEDTAGMLGVHGESEDFFADGKDATLYVAWMISETVVSMPQDRKRKKLGVGEEVNLTLKPSSLPSPTWTLSGTPGTSQINPLIGITSILTAGERACTPTTEAAILGEMVKIDFEVVEPSAMVMERYPGTGIRHTNGTASAGFQARAYIMPHDVSFTKIEVREGTCLATATGFIAAIPGKNGEVHANGAWIGVQQGTALRPSLWSAIDTISTGDYSPPFASGGTFNWPIPWLFKVSGGNEKQFTIATHNESVTGTGATTISKGGVSVTTQSNDPTSTY